MDSSVLEITRDVFEEEVLHSNNTILIEFYADLCGPCKMMLPILENLHESYGNKIKIFKMNVEAIGNLTKQLGIGSVPAVLFFKSGQVILTKFGLRSKQDLEKEILRIIYDGQTTQDGTSIL